MRVKTDVEAGKSISEMFTDAGNFALDAVKTTGEVAVSAVQGAWDLVTDPKFWTWPF